jgi:hypothetical protein
MACIGGACVVTGCGDLTDCTGNLDCTDLGWDLNNCGVCGNVCASGICEAGGCVVACEAGLTNCGGVCADLSADPFNCGGCGVVCESGICEGGTCFSGCGEGLAYCPARSDGQPAGCYDLSSNRFHCGACHNQCPTTVGCFAGACQVPPCDEGLSRCADGCVDLDADPNNCGECDNACESGVCEAGVCAQQAAQTAQPATTTQPEVSGAVGGQEPATAAGSRDRAARDRPPRATRSQDADAVLAWPFDPEAGQWTILHGYRAEDEGDDAGGDAASPDESRDYAQFALEFAVCPEANVDAEAGTCNLGEAGNEPDWDREATQGSAVRSPVDGTVAWTEGETSCLAVAIDVADHPGYRLALFNIAGTLERGQRVRRGRQMSTVAERGCERGDRIGMVLYRPQAGADEDPAAEREGVPFAGAWTIAGCDYPDDGRTVEQFRGELVPCTPEEDATAGS